MSKYAGNIVTTGADTGYSVYFDGTGDYLSLGGQTAFAFGTGDFTIETWVQFLAVPGNVNFIDFRPATNGAYPTINSTASAKFGYTANSAVQITGTTTIAAGTWYHVAVSRSGTSTKLFVNGVQEGSTYTDTTTYLVATGRPFIGGDSFAGTSSFGGYLSNTRIIKGTAVYTANFTPPTQLFNITNTSLLTCNSPAIIDQSSNAFAITANGNAAVSTFTPFTGYQAYNPALGAATPGVWKLSDALQAAATRQWNMYDPYFNYTTLKLGGNQPGGVTDTSNNVFKDSSSNNFTITRNGNTTQGTFTPFSQTGWSGNFNTSTTYLTVTDTANLRFGSGNFTIEAWVYRAASGAVQTIASKGASTPTGWVFQISAADKLVFTDTSTSITGATSLAANTWYYVAVVRSGTGTNQTTLYVNATSDATGTSATNFNQTTNMLIGADRSSLNFANGYISNLRLSNTNRTISSTPTSPLSADANTIFLSLNINRFQYTDSGGTYTSMTVTGTPSVQSFEPFAPGAAYSTSTVGGSGYFDGTGDYLTVANNAALQITNVDWTVESWIYLTTLPATSNYEAIAQKGRSANNDYEYFVAINNNAGTYRISIELSTNGTAVSAYNSTAINLSANSWNHIAVSKSGTTVYYFFNGAAVGTSTITSATGWYTGTGALGIGANNNGGAYLVNGYLSGTRITKGGALYTSAFTIPSAPPSLSVSAGTVSLLCNYANGAIVDATGKNVLETVGNAVVSTTQSKYGGSSMYFDGTGDYLLAPYNKMQDLTQGDFTVEGWFYRAVSGVEHNILNNRFTTGGILWRINSANTVTFSIQGGTITTITSTGTIPATTWTHIAVSRSGANLRIFINGVIDGSSTTAANGTSSTTVLRVGCDENLTNAFNGYMQDLRITQGYARYVAAFTPPTSLLQNQ